MKLIVNKPRFNDDFIKPGMFITVTSTGDTINNEINGIITAVQSMAISFRTKDSASIVKLEDVLDGKKEIKVADKLADKLAEEPPKGSYLIKSAFTGTGLNLRHLVIKTYEPMPEGYTHVIVDDQTYIPIYKK